MIQLEAISKAYGGQVLFRELSWRIGDRERLGLVGPNGTGKTTLCRLLAGLEPPDGGRVHRDRDATIGYLPQEVTAAGDGSVLGEALSGYEEVWAIEREMEAIAATLAKEPSERLTARYGDLQHRFEALGGYRLETEARTILGGLGFAAADATRPLTELSGGWRMRAALARLLLMRPSLLVLDEPTNHLDLPSLAWLEEHLRAHDGTVLVVSHDRYFLNRVVTTIAELGPGGVDVYHGDFDHYLVEREARRALAQARAAQQARRVAEIERFIERFRYQATRARQVQSRVKLLARLEDGEVARPTATIRLRMPAPPRTGRIVAALAGVHKSYGELTVYAGIDFLIERGERVALTGANGAGKSTLLRILAGVLPFERGERRLGASVTSYYYAQHQIDVLEPSRTVLEELAAAAPAIGDTRLRTLLGAFLFSGDAVNKRVLVLSGGEKARLALAKMLIQPAPLLCLDEPTNHLDLDSRERLEAALAQFGGTMVFVSHDRYFVNRLATRVVEVDQGVLTSHPGNYDDYQARHAQARHGTPGAAAPRVAEPPPAVIGPPRGRARIDPAMRARRRHLEELEGRIHLLETRLAELGVALGEPALYADGERARAITTERRRAEAELHELLAEWETLSTQLADDDAGGGMPPPGAASRRPRH